MTKLALSDWSQITATAKMPLYAVLSNVSDAQSVKNYYVTDGSQTPHGLYTGTPYTNWHSVMPMIVQLDENSPFLNWVSQTEYQNWGWLARSHLPFESICAHLRSLTQVIMPDGETVFFRYWDGTYLAEQIRFMADSWAEVLPAFAFYWVNGEPFTVFVPLQAEAQVSPWWQVPAELTDYLLQKNKTPLIDNIIQCLQEEYPTYYFQFDEEIIHKKLAHLLSHLVIEKGENGVNKAVQQLIKYTL